MIYNVSFDICAAIICVFALLIMIAKKDLHRESNRLLLLIIVAALVASVFDIWSSVGNSYVEQYSYFSRDVLNFVFLLVYVSTSCLFAWYMIVLLGLKKRMKKPIKIAFFIPEIVILLLLVLNFVFRFVFYYDENGIYLHGPMMYVLYGTGYLYMLVAVFLVIRYRKFLIRPQRYAAILLLVLSIVPIFIQQFIMPHQLIELFFQSIGIFGFLTTVENIDAIHNPVTKVYNRAAFLREIDLTIQNTNVLGAVIVKLSRSSYFDIATLGAFHTSGFIASIAEWLNSLSKKIDVYDCERGHFALLINHDIDYNIQELAREICSRFSKKWVYQNKEMYFPVQLCAINIPNELQTVEQVVHLVDYPYINENMEPVSITVKELETEWQEQTDEQHQLGAEILSMLDVFIAGVATLTPAEYNVLQYYIDGYEIAEIPNLAFISIHTVRKHNKSIYKKLDVGTKEELLIYINLLRRSNRLNEIERRQALS
ncbi:LuxR C-terminal-related transcriptional regulator [Christensenellaceae bacterium OttesenSCG-928-K19]|nr:LuxR C-terminal-related transcriptional regulator [Christensenellaceae bacterium OttesenSCG-928-K19]